VKIGQVDPEIVGLKWLIFKWGHWGGACRWPS